MVRNGCWLDMANELLEPNHLTRQGILNANLVQKYDNIQLERNHKHWLWYMIAFKFGINTPNNI